MADLMVQDVSSGERVYTFEQPAENGYYYVIVRAPDATAAYGMAVDESKRLVKSGGSPRRLQQRLSEGYGLGELRLSPQLYDDLQKFGVASEFRATKQSRHPKDFSQYWEK